MAPSREAKLLQPLQDSQVYLKHVCDDCICWYVSKGDLTLVASLHLNYYKKKEREIRTIVWFGMICEIVSNIHLAITIKLKTTVTTTYMLIGQRPTSITVLLCYM